MSKAKQFTSWSFSRWSDYKSCPAKAKYKHLDKKPEPKSEALARGEAIHKKAEKYISSGGARLPAELKKFDALFKRLRHKHKKNPMSVAVEPFWGFTKDWEPCKWDDWGRCVCRVKVDCLDFHDTQIRLFDWKTGKYRPEQHEDYVAQLDLYALGTLLLYPMSCVAPQLVYLDTGDMYPGEDVIHEQHDIDSLKRAWEKRVQPMLHDETFAPTPSYGCRWCAYRKEVGGPCAF